MKARECVEGSIDHCERSRLVGDGQCPGRILGRPCARVQTVSVQTGRLDARMLPGVIATHPLGLILYTITAGGFFIANWPLCRTFVDKHGDQDLADWIGTLTLRK